MRARTALPLASAWLALAGCAQSDRARSPAPTPTDTEVLVVDAFAQPYPGVTVVASRGERILGSGATGPDGIAVVPLFERSTVTAYVEIDADNHWAWAVTEVGPDDSVVVPVDTWYPFAEDTSDNFTLRATFPAGGSYLELYIGYCRFPRAIAVTDTAFSEVVWVAPECAGFGESFSLSGVTTTTASYPPEGILSFGVAPDLTLDATATVALSTTSYAPVAVSLRNVPGQSDVYRGVYSAFRRDELPLAPAVEVAGGVPADYDTTLRLLGSESADSLLTTVRGYGSGACTELHLSRPDLSAVSFDLDTLRAGPADASVLEEGPGGWTLTFLPGDPGVDAVEASARDTNLLGRVWHVFAPPPPAGTERVRIELPPVPDELAAWRLPAGQALDQYDVRCIDADYVNGYDDVEVFLGTIPADGTLVFRGGLPTCAVPP